VTDDDLELVVESDDPDGEELTFSYTWYVDGVPADLSDEVLAADETARDEVWSVEVVATDPSGAEATAWDTVTILNSAPSLQAVVLSPQPILGSDDLNCVPVGFTDPDDDPPEYAYQWNISGGGTDCSCHAETPEPVLSNSFYSRGYLVSCEITPMDDELAGPTVYSVEVEVANSAPDAPTVFIEPGAPSAGDELRAVALATDGDGDLLTLEYLWSVDGAGYGSDQVVPGQDVESGQTWTVEAWASDDELSGASGSASVTVQ
ncbi:MAG: hypothetical protein GY913_15355, partial [Proteobacteria bacterium]|nr:hypothetical protein [Pseudomonadota bacterium]